MSLEKKPANYYGGYSLYRGGAAGQPPQQAMGAGQTSANVPLGARKAAAAFGGDWFGNAMMMGMMPAVVPPLVPPVADGKGVNASVPRPGMPFFTNFFNPMPAPMPHAYKGAPLRAPYTVPQIAKAAPVSHAKHQRTSLGPAQGHFNEWSAFDAIVPTAPTQRHVDPIGTPAPSSVWDGTPAAAAQGQGLAKVAPCHVTTTTATTAQFSMWNSPVVATRSGATTPEAEPTSTAALCAEVTDVVTPSKAPSEEEDWMEHLKTTLHMVLLEEESASATERQPTPPKMKFEKEWSQRSIQGAAL